MRKVLTLVERDPDGAARRSACGLLTIARRLGEPVAVVDGQADGELIKVLGRFGASEIHCLAETIDGGVPQVSDMAETAPASDSQPSATDLLHHVADLLDPAAILITAGYRGQETAARLAIRLDSGIITNAVDVRPGPIAVQR